MEDDPNFSGNGIQPHLQEMEDDLKFSGNARRPQYFRKWKTTPIFQEIEDNINFSGNRSFEKLEDHLHSILADTKFY